MRKSLRWRRKAKCCAVLMADNVLQLGEVADFEAQMISFAQKFNRRTTVEFSTKPAILPNCCYAFALLLRSSFCRQL